MAKLIERHSGMWILITSEFDAIATLCKSRENHQWELVMAGELGGFYKFNSPGDCTEWLNDRAGMDVEMVSCRNNDHAENATVVATFNKE